MDALTRKPLQGVTNIIRFNWHFYVLALIFISILIVLSMMLHPLRVIFSMVALLVAGSTSLSLIISCYIYDYSSLYNLRWLNFITPDRAMNCATINAGFDETSWLIKQKFPLSNLRVLDFYDKEKHTEISIERARKLYAAYPNTEKIDTNALPLDTGYIDFAFTILSLHEIRNQKERIFFLHQLRQSLTPGGKMVIVEHLRDLQNFIVYTIGFFHFFSHAQWMYDFQSAGLVLEREMKITPFISCFILTKSNGATS